jgi:NTP pyrophosphatase (non-canonical NTP hydrolase)
MSKRVTVGRMTIEELQKFIDEQDAMFRALREDDFSEREHMFARTIKLGEEYGELCDEVLASIGGQRKDKMKDHASTDLQDEFADVVICTFMLAKALNVNIMQAIDHKVPKIREKLNKQC